MKIAVTLTVEIEDPADWTTAFGVEGAARIRQDVKDYVGSNVQGLRVWNEAPAKVSWK
ncbi:hypothetical protein ACGFYA_20755 [Streptomyces sp. NPDC048305]|uniref:hypothetical protein n=1 Tax=Streptomyces sp. NPDC048305 TaxID=3365532 RepID=UPI00371EDA6B